MQSNGLLRHDYVCLLRAVRSFFYILFIKEKWPLKQVFKGPFKNIFHLRNKENHSTCPWSVAPSCVEGGASNSVASCFSKPSFSKSFSGFLFRYVASWIDRRRHQSEKANLTILFDKYIPVCLEKLRTSFKTITAIPESSLVQVWADFLCQGKSE